MISIHDKDLIAKIVLVEGTEDWIRDLAVITPDGPVAIDVHTRKPALAAYLAWCEYHPIEDRPIATGVTIYGLGGWHRYFVRGNGDVEFSASHAQPAGRERARAVGFTCKEPL